MFSFKKDIEQALKKYTSLQFYEVEGTPVIKGDFTATNKIEKIEIDTYEVLICFPKNYPNAFPHVVETSKKIPRNPSRHVRLNNTLCFGNWQDELGVCKNGITLTFFLDEILNTHLCREYVKEKTGEYPTGERSHDNEGIWEGYYDIFNTTDKVAVMGELELILNHKPLGRNAPCYCDSGKRYKICHGKIEPDIINIGKKDAIGILEFLKKDFQNKNN